jgi:hypothetical protein
MYSALFFCKLTVMNSRWAGPMIAFTFLTSMIAIGHGIAPAGFILVILTLALSPYALVGWIAIFLLLLAMALSVRKATIVVWMGSALSFVAWLWLLYDSDWNSTILLSAHYFAAMFYFLVYRSVVSDIPDQN